MLLCKTTFGRTLIIPVIVCLLTRRIGTVVVRQLCTGYLIGNPVGEVKRLDLYLHVAYIVNRSGTKLQRRHIGTIHLIHNILADKPVEVQWCRAHEC